MEQKTPAYAASAWEKIRLHVHAWYWASRPFTLTASVVPVLVGSALAFQEGLASLHLFILVLLGSVLVQVGTNLVDEYTDQARPEGGQKLLAPYKVIALGLLSSGAVRLGALVSFGMATAIGLYLVLVIGWPILAICLASLAVAYLYAAGPRPLGSLALGWPLVFLFMGPVMVLGTYYVHTRALTLEVLWLSMPVAFLVTAILVANDLRDLEEDRVAGKITPVTLLGRPFGRWIWVSLVIAAFAVVVALATVGGQSLLLLLPLLALPQAGKVLQTFLRGEDRATLAMALRESAGLHWWLGLLLAAGVGLARFTSF